MPTEATLIDLLGVSRGALREALKALQAIGLVETRHGTGSFVGRLTLAPLADGLVFSTGLEARGNHVRAAADLADIREILECELIGRVAGLMDASHLKELAGIVGEMATALDSGSGDDFDAVDRRFHACLYQKLGNELVLQLLDGFWRALHEVRATLPPPFIDPQEAIEAHRAILAALVQADADVAREAMRRHFRSTRAWILGHV